MNFSASITVPQSRPNQDRALWEQLIQDGFANEEIHLPPLASEGFAMLMSDARAFTREVQQQNPNAWEVRCERWLQRLSVAMTGHLFTDLPITKRRAVSHAVSMLSADQVLPA